MAQRTSIIKILHFSFRGYKPQVAALLILSLLVGGLESTTVVIVYPILSAAFTEGLGEGNTVLSLFQGVAGLLPVADDFIAYCLLFMFLALSAFIVKLITISQRAKVSARLVKNRQIEIINKFVKSDYQYFIDHKEGDLIYNTIQAPNALATMVLATTEIMAAAMLSISVLFLLAALSWQGTIAVLLVGLVYHLFVRYLAEKISYVAGKELADAGREATVVLDEVFSGIRQVKVFAKADEWVRRFRDTMSKYWFYLVKMQIWSQALSPALTLTLYLSIGISGILLKALVPTSFSELIPILGTFAFALFRLTSVISNLSSQIMSMMGALPNSEVIYHILNENTTRIEDGEKELDSFKSKIEFDNVTFAYKGRPAVLTDISVAFEKGKTTAIVGRSGIGKTTFINLLLRLFDVDKGEVTIDGLNIKQYKSTSWLDKIGYVSQDTFIFNDTIKNNISFGSNYSDQEIIRASEQANTHGFISELPEGYETLVGDNGMKLSGGQKQRVAMARAIVRDPEILIFDEATNALDNISEAAVQKAINRISKDHTVIVVAHRLSTILNADKIVVLGVGKILEEGTHEELMAKGGAYSKLYQSQPA